VLKRTGDKCRVRMGDSSHSLTHGSLLPRFRHCRLTRSWISIDLHHYCYSTRPHTRSRSMIIQRVLEFFAAEHAGNHPPKTSGMPRGRRDATTRPTEAARRGRRCVRARQYSSRTREAGSSGTKLFLASQLAFFVRAGPADFARPTHLPGPYSHSPVSAECSI
jgi:hypothetical protein